MYDIIHYIIYYIYSELGGSCYDSNNLLHTGLGVWDTTNNKKYSIEFLSDNYLGRYNL